MWFAALGPCEDSSWLSRLFQRLLEGSPPVLGLFAEDPFRGRRPILVRATVREYHFADLETHRRSGAWWVAGPEAPFCPAQGALPTP
jgi:hypothetical protein